MHKEVKTAAEFDAAIATGKVLVDFWATWCGPCLMMGQVIESELEPAMPDLTVVKVNVDEAPELAAKFSIMSIPALFAYKNGVKVGEFIGVTAAKEIAKTFA
jgi:thioredoxin 1